MIKLGLVGFGHLGKIHAKCAVNVPHIDFVGVYDANPKACKEAEASDYKIFDSLEDLLKVCDAIDIVTPTPSHFEIAMKAIEEGKHVFLEKPITHTLEEAKLLQKSVRESGVALQVGHVERFNPAFLSLNNLKVQPAFIEGHRLATFNPRGTDVSVVLDLMIHDLDLILHITDSKPVEVQSHGVSIVSKSHDICNARIQFENGCVVNLTASRISLKQMRKLRVFQSNAYISMDFLERKSEIVRLLDEADAQTSSSQTFELDTYNGKKHIDVSIPEVKPVNAIEEELSTFAEAIMNQTDPLVGVDDGVAALELAYWIMEENVHQ